MKSIKETSFILEHLEERIAPAAVFTFQEADGDHVTVKTGKGTANDLMQAITLATNNEYIQEIDLSTNSVFAGTTLKISVKASSEGNSNGSTSVAFISAANNDLGKVKIEGHLGSIDAGIQGSEGIGLASLDVLSFGPSLFFGGHSTIQGDVGSLIVHGNMSASFYTEDGGSIKKVKIDGSLKGGSLFISGPGSIRADGSIGKIHIQGDIVGGISDYSGAIFADSIAGVTIGGALIGGSGTASGIISSTSMLGKVTIGGDVKGGTGNFSGEIACVLGDIAGVKIEGSLIGGNVTTGEVQETGVIYCGGNLGNVKIAGSLEGGSAEESANLKESGSILAEGRIAGVKIGGSFIAGEDQTTGYFFNNGVIRAHWDIGNITIMGDVQGNNTAQVIISGGGQETPSTKADIAIKSLKVGGEVRKATILGGYDPHEQSFNDPDSGINADAQIGKVLVGGNWTDSSILSGARYNYTSYTKIDDGTESAELLSKIVSLVIKGQATGSGGIAAQEVGSVKVGGIRIDLEAGPHNDNNVLVNLNGLAVHEVAA